MAKKKTYHKRNRRLLILFLIMATIIYLIVHTCTSGCSGPKKDKADSIQLMPRLNESLTNGMSDGQDPESGKAIAEMDSLIKRYIKRWELNGAQIAVSRHDSLLYCKGFGWADKERGEYMSPTHLMRIASVSKLVTAAGIMRLQEMHKLKLSDHVFGPQGILCDTAYTNVIKDKRYMDITVEHLLRHRAGFTNYAGDPMFSTRYIMMQNHLTTPPDHDTLLKIVLRRRLGYTPGEAQRYCNIGYMLLSMVIEKVTGCDYESWMRANVLEPAGCFDFHIAGNYYKDRRSNEVRYYMHQGSEPVYEYNNSGRQVQKCYGENDIPRLAGAGGWCASSAELCRFIAAIDGIGRIPDILSKQSVQQMTRVMPDHGFSIGWNFTPTDRPWERTGSLSGTSALVLKYPDGECWILITNTSTWKGHGFSRDTIAFFEKLRKKYGTQLPQRDLFFFKQ